MHLRKRMTAALLSLCMLAALCLTAPASLAAFADTGGHWAASEITLWAERGVLEGNDGRFRPDEPITRAEFAAVLCRIVGYNLMNDAGIRDMSGDEWYYGDMVRLYTAGILRGYGGGVLRPGENIKREEAAVLLARLFDVPGSAVTDAPFPDAAQISAWAAPQICAMKKAGYITGDAKGNFNPRADITRGEVVKILANMVDDFYNRATMFDASSRVFVPKNAVIRATGVTLRNYIVRDNLYIMEGVGFCAGRVTLSGVTVGGTLYIRGGGLDSITIDGASAVPRLVVGTECDKFRITVDDGVTMGAVTFLDQNGLAVYTGRAETMTMAGAGLELQLRGASADRLMVNESGRVAADADTRVSELAVNAPVTVTGSGRVDRAVVARASAGSSFETAPKTVVLRPGASVTLAGTVHRNSTATDMTISA